MEDNQLKRPYFPPQMTIVDFQVERGFDTSDVEVKTTQEELESYRMRMLLGLTDEQMQQYYNGGLPRSNSGYFSSGGNGLDGGGYFGEYF